ncbi:hypothetical protein [Colwellia sp. 20A7]|uniref:hypothetical protein n=1 Tax=Colwellia sp. 20A7 TaxID=2689569 RepID=UPI001358494A|nr:hypothetical protein [Colwellia sp. 20A7]
MANRKFVSEFGLNMLNGLRLLLQQEHLSLIDQTGIKPHIYIISRRPRISIVPESIKCEGDLISGIFRKQIKDTFEEIPFKTNNYLGTTDLTFKSEYPYTEYEVIDNKTQKLLANGKSALLLAKLNPDYQAHLDLEILYVGQSYGVEGARTAGERLKKHETLQGIYSEAIRKSPDQEIWLFVSEFEEILLASFDGRHDEYETTEDQDNTHIKNVLNNEMTEQQKINFTEAALIRHFQPPYNKIYKDTFPNPAHKTYSECYDIDLNMVCVELQTDELAFRFWSENVPPNWLHFCSFPLHSKEERMYMFEIDGEVAL